MEKGREMWEWDQREGGREGEQMNGKGKGRREGKEGDGWRMRKNWRVGRKIGGSKSRLVEWVKF